MARSSQRQNEGSNPVAGIASWLISQGLEGASREDLLDGYCAKLVSAGIPVQRVHVAQKALHPEFGGLGFNWYRSGGLVQEQYAHITVAPDRWVQSPFYPMLRDGINEFREKLTDMDQPHRFPVLDEFRSNGATDYFAVQLPFSGQQTDHGVDPNDPPEGIMISWTTDAKEGFSDTDLAVLRGLLPTLGLALKAASIRQTAQDLLAIYLGPDAGARVLSGEIQRGSLQTIRATILYFDLQSFTKLAEKASGLTIIEMLNDYFAAVVPVIEARGGNVLKFMGDGLLAIFNIADHSDACRSAIEAAAAIRDVMAEINQRRRSDGKEWTGFSLALHEGDVLYGNIGAANRLDFTVIGPAVNMTARIQGMCRSLEQNMIISSAVAHTVRGQPDDLISLGRYMLRGIPETQELFTIGKSATGR